MDVKHRVVGLLRRRQGSVGGPAPQPVDADQVVAAAAEVAQRADLHAVTLQAVADRLGTGVAAIERHHSSDDALRVAAYQRITGAELAEVKEAVLVEPDPVAQVRALAHTLAEPGQAVGTAVWLEGWVLARANAPLAAVVRGQMEAWQTFVASILHHGVQEGVFRDIDPDFIAAQLIGMVDGINSYALVGRGTGLDRARLIAAVLERELGVRLYQDRAAGDGFGR